MNAIGVPFPKNRWGEYVGYKTDHDPARRATSVGPYTSKCMTECLERAVQRDGIPVLDGLLVIRILQHEGAVCGLLCLDVDHCEDPEERFVLIRCSNVIWATGGPAGMYADSVYPFGQYGASGIAFAAGAAGQNLTEWQFGLASVMPRWNVSGSYMQAIPRFFSTDASGGDLREFLNDTLTDMAALQSLIFLKGYQWPFDVRKAADGSSLLDLLVWREEQKGRKVYLDYTQNPGGGPVDFGALAPEARAYLQKAGACLATPFERLLRLNEPAVAFYREKGVDLRRQPLQIALCAQHNNGGLAVNAWWETSVRGLFAAGEAAGTHGVYRPGGTALNAGQVGSARAAQYIAACRRNTEMPDEDFDAPAQEALAWAQAMAEQVLANRDGTPVRQCWQRAATRMSRTGGAVRDPVQIEKALCQTQAELGSLERTVTVTEPSRLRLVFRLWDMLLCQTVYLSAMLDYIRHGGKSRGSALYIDPTAPRPGAVLPDDLRFHLDDGTGNDQIQMARLCKGQVVCSWRKVRSLPQDDDFFENVWRGWRENKNIDEETL